MQAQEVQGRPAFLQLHPLLFDVSLIRQQVECREQLQQGVVSGVESSLVGGALEISAGEACAGGPECPEGVSNSGFPPLLRRFLLRGDISRSLRECPI